MILYRCFMMAIQSMLEQFKQVLSSPQEPNSQEMIKHMQDLILNALEQMFPPEHDFTQLAQLYENPQLVNNPLLLTYNLIDYFIQIVSLNFISTHTYQALQNQTQKQQSTIRSHIKLEQQVKIYLQHLQNKINKYETYIYHALNRRDTSRDEPIPSHRETHLLKERLHLIKRNEHLQRKLKEKEEELRKYNELNVSQQKIMENILEKDKMILSKSQEKLHIRQVSGLLNRKVSHERLKSQDSKSIQRLIHNKADNTKNEQAKHYLVNGLSH